MTFKRLTAVAAALLFGIGGLLASPAAAANDPANPAPSATAPAAGARPESKPLRLRSTEPGDGCKIEDACVTSPPPPPADISTQDAQACVVVSTGNGYFCGGIYGYDKYIDYFFATRQPAPVISVCDYQGNLSVFNASGTSIYSQNTSRHSGCSTRAWFDPVWTQRNFTSGDTACVSWFESGSRMGRVCFYLTYETPSAS